MNEIDDLVTRFNKIPVDSKASASNTTNMTPPATHPLQNINWELFKSRLDNIRPYDGNPTNLNKFLNRCEQFRACYNVGNTELETHVLNCIQEKLIDRAEFMVGNRVELNTWELIKNALIQCFSDKRNLDCMILELSRARLNKNEDLYSFGSRLQLIRSQVTHRINNDLTLSLNDKFCRIAHYDKVARDTFISECTGILKNNLHLKNPPTLEDAMAYVSEFENFEKFYGQPNWTDKSRNTMSNNNFNRQNQQNQFNQNAFRQKPANPPQFFTQQPNYLRPNFNFPQQNFSKPSSSFQQNFQPQRNFSNFSSQPNNFKQQFIPQRRLPTNSEVFGKPKDVFKPNPQNVQNLPPPQPMSTTSRNSTRNLSNNNSSNFNQNRQFSRTYNHFQNQGTYPDIIFEELSYHQDENSTNHPENQHFEGEYYNQDEQIENEEISQDFCEDENHLDFITTASNENQT